MEYFYYLKTPIGFLKIRTDNQCIKAITFVNNPEKDSEYQPEIMQKAIQQLKEYFKGNRKEFDLALKPTGTEFQIQTWKEVNKIPFGKTATYLDIAKKTGSHKNTRAVGAANGKNPIPIIIPCHRIIGTNGKLTGYTGGIGKKRWLLKHELIHSPQTDMLF